MQNRSALVQILTFLVAFIGAYGALFTEKGQAWLGVVAFTATILLNNPILTKAEFTKGWGTTLWVVNLGGIAIQVLQAIDVAYLIPSNIVNYIIIGVNLLIVTMFKKYEDNG